MAEDEQQHIHSLPTHTYKSNVWRDFGFFKKDGNLDKSLAICKICCLAIKYTGSTTNLITHLRRHSVAEEAVSESVLANSPGSDSPHATSSSSGANNTGHQQPSISTFFQTPLGTNSAHSKVITKAIAFYICKDIQPYSATEGQGFEYLMSVLELRYKKPGRKVFAEKEIPELYLKVKQDIAKSMHNANTVAMTIDGWMSCATDSFVTVTAHYIDEEWALQSHVLQTCKFTEVHTGKNLAALLQEVFRE